MDIGAKIYEDFKQYPVIFIIGVGVGIIGFQFFLYFLNFEFIHKDNYYTVKKVGEDYVSKDKFNALNQKYKDLQISLSGQFKTNQNECKSSIGKLKTELEIYQEKNNGLSKSLQQANSQIKKLKQVGKLRYQKDLAWKDIEFLQDAYCNDCDRTEDSKKIELLKIKAEQYQQQINILLSCTSSRPQQTLK
jgi:predicted nuclease with TOPRIM domain